MTLASRVRPLLLVVLLATVPARAEGGGPRWVAREVAFPVSPDAVLPHAPFVPPDTSRVRGEVELGPERAAAFFLEPRALVRVRVLGAEGQVLRLARVLGPPEPPASGRGPRALLEEEALVHEQARFVLQPPGTGNVWLLWAEQPLRVLIESPVHDPGLLIWEDARASLPRWVRGEAPFPELPDAPGTLELQQRLEAGAQLAAVLAEHPEATPALSRALTLWRTAEALRGLENVRPGLTGVIARTQLISRLEGMGESVTLEVPEGEEPGEPSRHFPIKEGHWEVELEGPGVVRFEARALLATGQGAPGRLLRLAVSTGGALLDSRQQRSVPVRIPAPEERAFPTPRPWQRVGESLVGNRVVLPFELLPGKHTYRLDFTGGPALLRLGLTRRRPLLSEWGRGRATTADWQRDAEKALAGDDSPPARLLRQLWSGTSSPVDLAEAPLPAALRAQLLVDDARRLARQGASAEALRVLLRLDPEAPPGALLQAADVLSQLPALPPESLELTLLERAWRLAPHRPEVRARYLDAFFHRTAWRQLPPATDGAPLEPWRWLDALAPSTGDDPGEDPNDSFWVLGAGESGMLEAPPAPTGQPAWLRAWLETGTEAPGPVELTLGGERLPLLGLARLEPVEFLLPPGRHPVRLEGPPTARLHLSLPLAEAPGPSSRVRRGWPAAPGGAPLPFTLPPSRTGRPVRFELRGLEARGPVSVLIEGAGPPRRLRFEPGEPVTWSAPLNPHAPPASAPVVGVLEVPAGTRALSFNTDGASPLAVTVATRWPELAEPDVREEPSPELAPDRAALARLRTLSLALRERPQDAVLRHARARLLLSLGEERLALGDLLPLAAEQAGEEELATLLAEASSVERPRHLELVSRALTGPLLLRPALSSLPWENGVATQLSELARTLRQEGVDPTRTKLGTGEGGPHTAYLRARLLLEEGARPEEGARLLTALAQDGDRWRLLLETAQWLDPVLSALPEDARDTEGLASLAFGVAARLEENLAHPTSAHLRTVASRRTRWEGVEEAEESGGLVQLTRGGDEDETDATPLRRVLVGAPWPLGEGHALRAGGHARVKLELPAPARIRVEVVCAALEPRPKDTLCPVALRVDSGAPIQHPLSLGALQELDVGVLSAGSHQLELHLPPEQAGLAAEARFLHATGKGGAFEALPPQHTITALLARKARPVVLTVLGPATLRVESWGHGESPAPHLGLEALPLSQGTPITASLRLPASGSTGLAPEPGRYLLLLTRREPYRVVLRPPEGGAAVRLALRVVREQPLPGRPRRRTLVASQLPLPEPTVLPEPLLPGPGRAPVHPWRFGTLSLLAGPGWETQAEDDALETRRGNGTTVALAWRYALKPERLWLRLDSSLRVPTGWTSVLGGRIELGARGLPLELRLRALAEVFAQRTEEAPVWRLQGRLLVDRIFHPALDWQVIPSLGLWVETAELLDRSWDVDPQIENLYGLDHPRRLNARLATRWLPLQDHLGTFFTRAMSNADLVSLDNVEAGLTWHGLLGPRGPLPLRVSLGYALSYRFADEHRDQSYLRHQGELEVDVHLWRGESGRLLLWGRDTLRYSSVVGLEHTGWLGLRLDFSRGRGWRDLMPWEEEFESLLEGRRWKVDDDR